jgi:hypothetical protein
LNAIQAEKPSKLFKPFQLKKIQEAKREEKKRLADEDATRRIRQLEEQCAALQKQVWIFYLLSPFSSGKTFLSTQFFRK